MFKDLIMCIEPSATTDERHFQVTYFITKGKLATAMCPVSIYRMLKQDVVGSHNIIQYAPIVAAIISPL